MFMGGDLILKEGDHGDMMYFINKGSCKVLLFNGNFDSKENAMFDKLDTLGEGCYFGEVALVTELKRTASIQATKVTYCMSINRDNFTIMEDNFPHLVDEMKMRVRTYNDPKMVFRRNALRNVPWLRRCDDNTIKHVLEKVDIRRYGEGGIILKKGDKSDKLFVIFEGMINIWLEKTNPDTEEKED